MVPATVPTTSPTEEGDLVLQIGRALQETGVTETVVQTPLSNWLLAFLAIFCGLLMARVASSLLRKVGEHRAMRVKLFRAVIYNSLAGPLSLFLFMVGLATGLYFLTIGPILREFLIRLFQLLNILCIGWLLYNLVDLVTLALNRWARRRKGNLGVMMVPMARRTLRVMLIIVLALFVAENVFKQDVKALIAGLGIAGLAISLAAQDTIKNVFGSVMIVADQPFAIGDYIVVGSNEGTVEDIGFRSTRLRTADGFLLTVPNSQIADSAVRNNSRRTKIRRVLDLGLVFDTPPDKVKQALDILRGIFAEPDVVGPLDVQTDPVRIHFMDMLTDQLRLRVQYWFPNDYWRYMDHAQHVNLRILERFAEAGIDFAFPTQTMLLAGDPKHPLELRRASRADHDATRPPDRPEE